MYTLRKCISLERCETYLLDSFAIASAKGQLSIINIGIALGYGHSFLVFDAGLRDPRGIWRKSVLFGGFAFINKELETYKNV